ncbi:hypothetical protein NDU88_002972 [Pleurodeles waltl]|uniref:BRICHOS domain-containing protein n=1 Tax=Pleurodeles waltl TaxID=8319 RepID=A0AAV7TNA8_PLEWA|nr:hypothetical protein NDU88_002972 [Pleurodeles waltl]
MKTLILVVALLGVFQTHAAPNEAIKVLNPSVKIDKGNNVISISNNFGLNSWDTVLDYTTGFIATRLFSRRACVVIPLKSSVFPSAEQFDKQPVPVTLKYSAWQTPIEDLSRFGAHVEALCDGIQTFPAVETGDIATFGECANSIIITILGITICF